MKHFIYSTLILLLCSANVLGQNTISVPFPNGFAGLNGGNNSADSCYYLTGAQGVGWSNVQFTQTTNGSIFTAQGNDIVGEVLITDFLGVTHQIPGFIKWRTPSGNNPHTMVFQPAVDTFVLATNGFNGSSTYTIDQNNYIGLTKLGSTLTINPVPGTVTGNSSTSGLLDALNDILGDLPHLDITGTTVQEADGTAQVTVDLSVASVHTVTVNFDTYSATANTSNDYDSTALTLTFLAGETQKPVNIPITVDAIGEFNEFFMAQLLASTNAAIITSEDSVIITDVTLPVTFVGFNINCEHNGYSISWSTATEYNSDRFEIEKSNDEMNWISVGFLAAQGYSNQITEYEFNDARDCFHCQPYYRIKQLDFDGQFEYSPTLSTSCSDNDPLVSVHPNPTKDKVFVFINLDRDELIQLTITDLSGSTVAQHEMNGKEGYNEFAIDIHQLQSSYYLLQIKTSNQVVTSRLQVTK